MPCENLGNVLGPNFMPTDPRKSSTGGKFQSDGKKSLETEDDIKTLNEKEAQIAQNKAKAQNKVVEV